MRKVQEGLNEDSGTDHLWNQVEDAHGQRADADGELDTGRVEFRIECIGEGEFAESFHRLGDDEQRDDPTGQIANRV